MNKYLKIFVSASLLLPCLGWAAHTDQSGHLISTVQFDGNSKHLYFRTSDGENNKWKVEGCNPTYVWVKPEISGQKEILSIGLSAKMAGKKVWFYGACSSADANYFEAHYIVIL